MTEDSARAGRPRPTWRRRLGLGLAVSTGVLVALGVLGEVALRVYHLVRETPPDLIVRDDRLGWRPTQGISRDRALTDGAGVPYAMHLTQDADGFRITGEPAKGPRARLLVLGDSFTQAVETDDQALYYARLGRALDAEVFGLGGGGWGSLQECLILEDLVGRVQPDLVLWQYCSNDFINNDLELERGSCCNNNGTRRPYLELDGDVRFGTPKPVGWLWDLKPHSRLLRSLLDRWMRLGPTWGACVEDEIAAAGRDHPGFRRAVDVTRAAMARAKRACGAVPLIAFAADERQPHLSEFQAICAETGIGFIGGVAEAVAEARRAGRTVVAEDGAHWNALGHELAAEVLGRGLREAGAITSGE